MTATAMPGTGRRQRVVAIGSGFGGLTATKALKHDLVNITDVVAFLTRITAQGTAHVHNQMSLWLQVVPTAGAAFATVGVLITLYVATVPHQGSGSAASDSMRHGSLWRSQRTPKGWC
jgi:hypothetical protein